MNKINYILTTLLLGSSERADTSNGIGYAAG